MVSLNFLYHLANQVADLLAKKKGTKLLLTVQGFFASMNCNG